MPRGNRSPEPMPWLSAAECNRRAPDHDYGSTIDNLEHIYQASPSLACWRLERLHPSLVDPLMLITDPDADHKKVESIRSTMRTGGFIPPVFLVHHLEDAEHPYALLEGMHRFNAYHRQDTAMFGWVAHIGCCGGPAADLEQPMLLTEGE